MSSTREADAKIQRLFDVRTLERNIKKGLTTRKDYEKYLKGLADAAENVATTEEHVGDVGDDGAEPAGQA
jgi:hypothetical protein